MVNYLSQFNFKIVYKPEKTNLLPDLLSRNPILEYFEKEDAVKTVNLADFNEILHDHQKMGENIVFIIANGKIKQEFWYLKNLGRKLLKESMKNMVILVDSKC